MNEVIQPDMNKEDEVIEGNMNRHIDSERRVYERIHREYGFWGGGMVAAG